MTNESGSRLQRLVLWLASKPAVVAFASKTQHHADRVVLWLSGNRTTFSSLLTGVPVMMVNTVGAKSGKPRTSPLLCIRSPQRPGQFVAIGTNWGQSHKPGWYYNLKANPHATVVFQGKRMACTVREVDGADYGFWWRTALAVYPSYALYKTRVGDRHIPIMLFEPLAE